MGQHCDRAAPRGGRAGRVLQQVIHIWCDRVTRVHTDDMLGGLRWRQTRQRRSFFFYLDHFSRISQRLATPTAPHDVLYLPSACVFDWMLPAIRYHARFTSTGTATRRRRALYMTRDPFFFLFFRGVFFSVAILRAQAVRQDLLTLPSLLSPASLSPSLLLSL